MSRDYLVQYSIRITALCKLYRFYKLSIFKLFKQTVYQKMVQVIFIIFFKGIVLCHCVDMSQCWYVTMLTAYNEALFWLYQQARVCCSMERGFQQHRKMHRRAWAQAKWGVNLRTRCPGPSLPLPTECSVPLVLLDGSAAAVFALGDRPPACGPKMRVPRDRVHSRQTPGPLITFSISNLLLKSLALKKKRFFIKTGPLKLPCIGM